MSEATTKPTKDPTATICLSPYAGGMERDAIAITKNMATLARTSILITRTDTWLHRKALADGISVEPVKMRAHISVFGATQLRRLWEIYEVRNIVFLGSSEMPTIFLSLIGMDINLIVRHGTTKRRSKKNLIHNITWSKVKSHWCISQHLKRNVEEIFPNKNKNIFLAYTNQEQKFKSIPIAGSLKNTDETNFLYVGRLEKSKGVGDAIEIVSGLKERGHKVELNIVGAGPYEEEFKLLSKRLGADDVIKFLGSIDDPYSLFGYSDIFIFPSKGEGLPNAFLEALYSGMHCFVYENTVFPELYNLGLQFYFLPTTNKASRVEFLSKKLRYLSLTPIMNNRFVIEKTFSKHSEDKIISHFLV